MRTGQVIVLIVHGMIPRDLPGNMKKDYKALREKYRSGVLTAQNDLSRYFALEEQIRHWPRSERNDPFFFGAKDIAEKLADKSGLKVYLGFNEFCSPSAEEVLETAAGEARHAIVLTPMLTPGGYHAEEEIPALIDVVKKRCPETVFQYAWPYDTAEVSEFLAGHLNNFLTKEHLAAKK